MVQNISELTIFNDAERTKIRLLPGKVMVAMLFQENRRILAVYVLKIKFSFAMTK
jgi:hypothetical protein